MLHVYFYAKECKNTNLEQFFDYAILENLSEGNYKF